MPLDPERDAAFLCDICKHAEDDAPRLIYADWLEENGEPLSVSARVARHRRITRDAKKKMVPAAP
ncbi:MAG: TIGR02996 domain-containing protein [Planctomycetes bacterium]|nr:TIGR02996 domain-containing protein [Planctomycetota bacterium]